jgi:DHA3 family tetracycline resistance protein-like MFS transporter
MTVVRGQRILVLILAMTFFFGLSSEGLDRLWEAHFLANITFPSLANLSVVTWFGLINVVGLLLNLGLTEVVRRRIDTDNNSTAVLYLLLMNVGYILSLVVFALAVSFPVGLISIWSLGVFRRIGGPVFAAWTNKKLKPGSRATVLSMRGQLDAIGQFIGGPIVGALGTIFSLRVSLLGVALFVSPVLWLYRRALKLERESEVEALASVPTAD